MPTTHDDIGKWFDDAVRNEATHMLIVCDTFDFEDFPVHVPYGRDAQEMVDEVNRKEMLRVMEVYDLSLDKDVQLGQTYCWNTGPAPVRGDV